MFSIFDISTSIWNVSRALTTDPGIEVMVAGSGRLRGRNMRWERTAFNEFAVQYSEEIIEG